MEIADLHRNAALAAALLRTLGNDRRLMIVCELTSGEKTVGELEKVVGLRQSALSQHLARLRRDGLVATRRSAQNIYYSLVNREAATLIDTLAGLYCARPASDDGEPASPTPPGLLTVPPHKPGPKK